MSSFEKTSENRLEIDLAYHEAVRALSEERINMDDFTDLYSEENVRADKNEVARLKELFAAETSPEKEEAKKLATILEAIIYREIELSDWLGPNAMTVRPSEYDDIKNGLDVMVEFPEEQRRASHLGLAIDVTFSDDLTGKFERIKKEIKEGKLTNVKYFNSEHMGIRGELKAIPRVVVGASLQIVKELSDLWMEGKKKELAAHPIQYRFLEEILFQLHMFKNYAESAGQSEAVRIYGNALAVIDNIIKEKDIAEKLKEAETEAAADPVHNAIKIHARNFGRL